MSDGETENENENEERINIMTLGNSEVGKTCYILKYTENFFQELYLTTVGIDFKIKTETINNKQYKLFLYDTTGQEKYKSIALNIIRNAQGIILMYDITNKKSFESIPEWIKSIRDSKGENFPMILLGNKLDKEDIRVISEKEGKELADEYGIKFFETSNKTGVNIQESGMALVNEILKIKENEIKDSFVSKSSHNSKLSSKRTTLKSEEKRCC
jgi:small GTP-binding protein